MAPWARALQEITNVCYQCSNEIDLNFNSNNQSFILDNVIFLIHPCTLFKI